ncbi:hypothetical protein [Cellulomonas uda]|uniref:Uncharacterized protein n=1 Tax=Cellulomonas uda TaxID=1714 RepID=A0A4Y3KD09_CELUD|nr:hypothetical protein [Cellulomonas uda]NII65542.1 hypothetical protein [Cellulomonas uda]GEA80888.1 hypothetical protein CUD01_13320 [Cellulomonas uda]
MGAAVQLVAGQVRVGDATFPGGLLPDGRVAVLGARLRRLRLRERDDLVALAAELTGPDAVRTLARLVLAAACGTGSTGDDETRAALEAVALHLAGAEHEGALVRTRLLATRAAGAAGGDLAAADADDLAGRLAHAVTDDDGWTRIALDPEAHVAPRTPDDVRDHLAAGLLARAGEALDPGLARVLVLAAPDGPADAGTWVPDAAPAAGGLTPPADPDDPPGPTGSPAAVRAPLGTPDDRTCPPADARDAVPCDGASPLRPGPVGGRASTDGRWSAVRSASRQQAEQAGHDDGASALTSTPGGAAAVRPASAPAERHGAALHARPDAAHGRAATATGAPLPVPHATLDRWGAPDGHAWPTAPGPSTASDATVRGPGRATTQPRAAAAPGAPGPGTLVPGSLVTTGRAPGRPLDDRSPAPARPAWTSDVAAPGGEPVDTDALARALHRAADLRGVRR